MKSLRLLLLVLLGAGVSAQTDPTRDAIFAAIRRGSVADAERLLKTGASSNIVDADGTPVLMAATLFGDADLVKLLLDRGADPNRAGVGGTTALMWAVPNLQKVRLLLDRGAQVNARSETDRTALLIAASYPRTVEVVRLLLDRGADIRAQDRANATALALAVRSADVDVVRFLVERGLELTELAAGARRSGFTRNDLATTDYVMSKAPAPNQ
ncbi:MAG TPA: ankyrin repeat domain-containing protein, partial [Vicinamibacterales bacterium]|nr:ankyrin repeat domain-containing protein [Vicinamibacterales bacterium]